MSLITVTEGQPPEVKVIGIPLPSILAVPVPIKETRPFRFASLRIQNDQFRLRYYILSEVRKRYGTKFHAGFSIACWLHPADVEFDPSNPWRNAVGEWVVESQMTVTGAFGTAVMAPLAWGEKRDYTGRLQGHALYYDGGFKAITGFYKVAGILFKE